MNSQTCLDWLNSNPFRKYRLAHNPPLTLRAAAELIGSTATSVQYWETGKRQALPKHIFMIKIADLLQIEVGNLYLTWQEWLSASPALIKEVKQ